MNSQRIWVYFKIELLQALTTPIIYISHMGCFTSYRPVCIRTCPKLNTKLVMTLRITLIIVVFSFPMWSPTCLGWICMVTIQKNIFNLSKCCLFVKFRANSKRIKTCLGHLEVNFQLCTQTIHIMKELRQFQMPHISKL